MPDQTAFNMKGLNDKIGGKPQVFSSSNNQPRFHEFLVFDFSFETNQSECGKKNIKGIKLAKVEFFFEIDKTNALFKNSG